MEMVIVKRETCSKCGSGHGRTGQRHCLACHAAYMREWRKTNPLNELQKKKDIARSYAGVYKRRGRLMPEPCPCGEEKAEMHHPDYDKPLEVQWLCRECHLELHKCA